MSRNSIRTSVSQCHSIRCPSRDAVLKTSAWVTTGGTHSGVMQLVGKALRHMEDRPPVIGFAPWSVVAGRDKLAAEAEKCQGRVSDYASCLSKSEAVESQLDKNHSHFVLVTSEIYILEPNTGRKLISKLLRANFRNP